MNNICHTDQYGWFIAGELPESLPMRHQRSGWTLAQAIGKGRFAMTDAPCESYFPKAAILSRFCLAIHFIKDAFAGAWRFNFRRKIIALIQVPFNRSIPFGKMLMLAAASAILKLSASITRFIHRFRISQQIDLFGKIERPEEELDLFDECVEITIRIDDHGFDILRKPRCVVTVNLPKEGSHSKAQIVGNASNRNQVRYRKQDHKLPFWVR